MGLWRGKHPIGHTEFKHNADRGRGGCHPDMLLTVQHSGRFTVAYIMVFGQRTGVGVGADMNKELLKIEV